ncbi:MAG: hypothetical protein KAT71_08355 [Gammaproteobacteria bacterium]|nr:hypothetical protein [Gammaproteobacteria bacterium]
MTLEIVRFANHEALGCPGRLYQDGKFIAYTMEQPWASHETSRGGKPYKSCVPEGIYSLVDYESTKYGNCKILVNPNLDVVAISQDRMTHEQRFKCLLFHRGNYHTNFKGCIGAGENYQLIIDAMGITSTKRICKEVNELIKDEDQIIIRWLI